MPHPRSRSRGVSAQVDDMLSKLFDLSVVWVSMGYANVIAQLDAHRHDAMRARLRVERSLRGIAQKLVR